MSLTKEKAPSESTLQDSNIQKITDSIQRYIVRPSTLFGISGFVFDVEGETKITHTSNITDNYVENNTALQDHIAPAPIKINLTRYVGELVDSVNEDPRGELASLAAKLAPVLAFAPQLTQASSFVKNTIIGNESFNKETISEADNLYALFQNLNPNASKKQQAYIYFKALQEKGITLSIQTPFAYFQNMAIESLIATEEEETTDIATFSMTLKQIRFASVTTVDFNKAKFQNRARSQNSPVAKNGKAQGKARLRSTGLVLFN